MWHEACMEKIRTTAHGMKRLDLHERITFNVQGYRKRWTGFETAIT
jgi:hypothetical protein